MTPDIAAAHLDRARSGIRQALAQWNPADLPAVESSRELLAAAVGDVRVFESAVRAGDVPHTAQLRDTIVAVKKEVMQATRVVDACVAFHRGLLARTGGAPPTYDADGCIAGESAELEPEVHA
jgi:hypothetical protein